MTSANRHPFDFMGPEYATCRNLEDMMALLCQIDDCRKTALTHVWNHGSRVEAFRELKDQAAVIEEIKRELVTHWDTIWHMARERDHE